MCLVCIFSYKVSIQTTKFKTCDAALWEVRFIHKFIVANWQRSWLIHRCTTKTRLTTAIDYIANKKF